MLLMDRIAGDCRLVLQHGAGPHPEMREAIAVATGKARATQADIDEAAKRGCRLILDKLRRAPRFVVDRRTADLIATMLDQPTRLLASAKHMFAPAEEAWVELDTEDGRIGMLLTCREGSLTDGSAGLYLPTDGNPVSAPIDWDLTKPRGLVTWLGGQREFLERALAAQAGHPLSVDLEKAALLMLGLFAVLCTPRLCIQRAVDRTKLNRARARTGKWPLLAYHEVVIDLSKSPTVTPPTGVGSPRALHFVRAHLRARSTGRIELVRPHWRGDAQLGIKRPAYRVTA